MGVNLGTRDKHISITSGITLCTQTWKLINVNDNIANSLVYNNDEDNRAIYGGLYCYDMISTIEALYPGWHVPSLTEWQTLATCLGGYLTAGGHMKIAGDEYFQNQGNKDGSSGWLGMPGGYTGNGGEDYSDLTTAGYFLCSSLHAAGQPDCVILQDFTWNLIYSYGYSTSTYMFSVRLVKD